MLPESFGGRIIYLLQQYGSSFAKGAGVSMWLALVGTLFGCIIGFLVGIVNALPVVSDMKHMSEKGIILNAAFLVCTTAAVSAHLGFVLGVDAPATGALLAAKFAGGIASLFLAFLFVRRMEA